MVYKKTKQTKNELLNDLINNFQEDNIATKKNIENEKQLNTTIKKIIAHNKKLTLKPINTHCLLKE